MGPTIRSGVLKRQSLTAGAVEAGTCARASLPRVRTGRLRRGHERGRRACARPPCGPRRRGRFGTVFHRRGGEPRDRHGLLLFRMDGAGRSAERRSVYIDCDRLGPAPFLVGRVEGLITLPSPHGRDEAVDVSSGASWSARCSACEWSGAHMACRRERIFCGHDSVGRSHRTVSRRSYRRIDIALYARFRVAGGERASASGMGPAASLLASRYGGTAERPQGCRPAGTRPR
jgi:hypothetical protein